MATRPHLKGIPPELRSETAILAAIAREALLECHVRHAVELIELARGRVPAERLLDIYARLHYLDEEMLADVRGRTLATLGERALHLALLEPSEEAGEDPGLLAPPVGVWSRVRAVFRGRILHSLRRDVDQHTGRTEIELMEVHTEHALRFSRALEKRFALSRSVRIYADAVALRDSLRETLYLLVLSRTGDDQSETRLLELIEPRAEMAAMP
jgi:hypothetical protein